MAVTALMKCLRPADVRQDLDELANVLACKGWSQERLKSLDDPVSPVKHSGAILTLKLQCNHESNCSSWSLRELSFTNFL